MSEELYEISERRLTLVRKLIDLAYTCPNKELFFRKFQETVSIDSLKDLKIVGGNENALQIYSKAELSQEEIGLYDLMQQGFTPQEIAIICKEKSVNAVYIKRHRIRKKLKGEASPEIVLVMLIMSIIAWIVLKLFLFTGV